MNRRTHQYFDHSSSSAASGSTANSRAQQHLRGDSEELRLLGVQQHRPHSPGLPLHRDTSPSEGGLDSSGSSNGIGGIEHYKMSNMELHDSGVGSSSSRRRGGGAAAAGQSRSNGMIAQDGNDDYDYDEKSRDYMLDRDPASPVSTSPSSTLKEKGKDKWSKLIPTDIAGGSSRVVSRHGVHRTRRSGLMGIVDVCKDYDDLIPVLIYTILSLWTRLYRIDRSNTVVWDEAHFGKFGAYYLNQTFYFDVHPPLGKMLVGLAGALSGFNGSYDFPSGQEYPPHVPFRAMRIMLAMPGVLMVPLAYGTAYELRFTNYAKHLVTLITLCDMAWLVISRFILLDSMLLFFTFSTVYFLACFHNQQRYPFSIDWWIWLSLTGASIGCVTSVKWIGMFVTALVGLYTIIDLWDKLGDLRMPYHTYMRHFIARAVCLILLPISIYMFCFKLHFLILNRSGPGDAQMSSLFQAHLHGSDFGKNPLEAAFGSKLTLKNMGYGGGLLHSHVQTYPTGSQQQQVTCYHYKDTNNEWTVTPTWEDGDYDANAPIRFLNDGDTIRLIHAMTGRNLHSHPVQAPVTAQNHEVSCYGNATIGDSNDYWIVEIVDDLVRGKRNVKTVHSLTTRLRFRHQNLGCYLKANNVALPQWGFKQIEVSCEQGVSKKDEHTYWNIESHWNDRLPPGEVKLYRSPFLRDFWHLNVAMMTSNNALVPDPDKDDIIASKPLDWPFLHLGMRMNGWHDASIKYYLLGHPLAWWFGTLSLPSFLVAIFWYMCRFQRKYQDLDQREWDLFFHSGLLTFGGWCFHYIPFLLMGRVTYLHHYLPCQIFAALCLAFLVDHFIFKSKRLRQRTKAAIFTVMASAVVGTFIFYRAAAWGIEGPVNDWRYRKWRSTWNIYNE